MSIYQNGNKIMGENILDLNTDKVKEIADAEINTLVPDIKKNMLICPNDKSPKEFAVENSTYAQVIEFVQWTGTPHADSVAQYVTYKFIRGTDANWATLVAIIYEQSKRTIKYCYYNGYQTTDNLRWGDWVTINTSKVADVPKTTITFSDETNYSVLSNSCVYFVKNGICTMMLYVKCNTPSTSWITLANVPKSDKLHFYSTLVSDNGNDFVKSVITINGELKLSKGTAGTNYLATFSYPVAES